ncbi:MAG: hypothetical protein IT381_33090 [Deltaproteobacteria bacterium]|nr:hypothetical protein [Deltaproteobacteria bacterium]
MTEKSGFFETVPSTVFTARKAVQPEVWTRAFKIAKITGVLLALSLGLNALLTGLAVALAFRPADVVVVDKLGQASFVPAAAKVGADPVEVEAEAFARQWVRDFMSLDAVTAKDDLARALSATHPELQKRLRAQLIDSGAIDKIRAAFVHSSVKFDDVRVARAADDRFSVTVTGARTLTAMGATNRTFAENFSLELVLVHTERTRQSPNGLLVRYAGGSFGDNLPIGEKK